MILDARRVPGDTTLECDICIVGAGAAGITVARELSSTRLKIILLESGGVWPDSRTQRLTEGEVVSPEHHGPLNQFRMRRLGGTTTVWGGWCAPFDEVDFEPRPYVPHSGWPINRRDLDPYYRRAHDYCELGAFAYQVDAALPGAPQDMIPGLSSEDVRMDGLWRCSPPTDFGRKFRGELKRATNIETYIHATALKLIADQPSRVDGVSVGSLAGNRFTVRARRVVLAMGGLEVTRLLLLSDDVHRHGIGNDNDLVGRYYLSHLSGDAGNLEITPRGGPPVWNYERGPDLVYCRRRLSIAPEAQRRERLPNFTAILDRPAPEDPSHGSGILSAMHLSKRALGRRSSRTPLRLAGHMRNLLMDLPSVFRFSGIWVTKQVLSKRRLPSVVVRGKGGIYALHYDAEQAPNSESRVVLGEGRDPFGLRRLKVDWRFTEEDVDGVVRSAQMIDDSLRRGGVGRLLADRDAMRSRVRIMASVGSHHLGTTRMSKTSREGVVDPECRVHGIDNLYIASGSVFPTSSFARPTLTIVALALRLADHLKATP